jgi:hypothetical protein
MAQLELRQSRSRKPRELGFRQRNRIALLRLILAAHANKGRLAVFSAAEKGYGGTEPRWGKGTSRRENEFSGGLIFVADTGMAFSGDPLRFMILVSATAETKGPHRALSVRS